MLARLSSKGQLVIPKAVRDAMGLQTGTELNIQVREGKIILEPAITSPVDALYGRYPGADLLDDLESEHREEIQREATIRA